MAAALRNERLLRTILPQPRKEQAITALDGRVELTPSHPLLIELANDLTRYCTGASVSFRKYAVDLEAIPPFLRQVLLATRAIPFGQLRTYGWLAAQTGRPGAARAVGQAMARNPLPIIIPCHRVVASNGGLGGFGGGLELKRKLLSLEGVKVTSRGVEVAS
jgi:methylated-DNA-[protein]-cysteine S-methyltransferase